MNGFREKPPRNESDNRNRNNNNNNVHAVPTQ